MSKLHCAYHPDREAHHQCIRCGRMLCDECYDSETGSCKFADCAAYHTGSDPDSRYSERRESRSDHPAQQSFSSNPGCQIVISILAIVGGLFLLFLAICGGMIFLNY